MNRLNRFRRTVGVVVGLGVGLAGFLSLSGCDDEAGRLIPGGGLDASAGDSAAGPIADGCATLIDLPKIIEANLTVGPGCVRADKTQIRKGATLTISPGTTVLMLPGAHFDLETFSSEGGTLVSVGTAALPIRFTSAGVSPLPGDWQCIYLGRGAENSEIAFTTFQYGGAQCGVTGSNDDLAALIIRGGIRGITNSAVTDSASLAIKIENNAGIRAFNNNRFARNGKLGEASLSVPQNEIVTIGTPNTFEDADDYISVNSTFPATRSGTWLAHPVPYRASRLSISDNAEIKIAAGAKVQINGGTVEVFRGNLITEGTATAPVMFTSSSLTPRAGDWGCIYFSSVTGVPSFTHTIIEYGGNGSACTGASHRIALYTPSSTRFSNTTIRNISGGGIIFEGGTCEEVIAPTCAAVTFSMLTAPAFNCGPTAVATACP